MSDVKLLEGKTIIVTGTARGMGHQMVEVFAKNGANVIAHARIESDEHRDFCTKTARNNNVTITPIYFDLADDEAIKKSIKEIRSLKVEIDGLVNNAGVTYNALFQMSRMDEVRKQMEVNFFGPFLFTQYISKLMVRAKHGNIVNIASTAGLDGNSGKSAYGASKAALICLTSVLAEELGVHGIRANVICPGIVETEMIHVMPDYIVEGQKNDTMLGKLAVPTDIANTAMYLLSDRSSYVTGQIIRVDGGVAEYNKGK